MGLVKKTLKWAGMLLAAAVLMGGAFLAHTWYFKPVNINLFFARAFLQVALQSPEMLSSLRVLEPLGITGHNAHLDDESIAAGDRLFEHVEASRNTLLRYADEGLSETDRLSKRIMLGFADRLIEARRFRFHNYPVNQFFGVQNGFPSFMDATHQVHSLRDAEYYVARLAEAGRKFDQVLDGLRHRQELGILPPQFVIDRVLEGMREFVATPAEENILMSSLRSKMEAAGLPADQREQIAAAARAEVEDTVYPAYGRLIEWFENTDRLVSEDYGFWALPDGDAAYAFAVRMFTTTDYTPNYIHELGLREVQRLQAEILDLLAVEGWDVSAGFTAAVGALSERPEFYYPDSAAGREQILADYRAIIDEISGGLQPWFEQAMAAPPEVKRVPEFREKTASAAYYQGASMDGSRPGVFYANLYDVRDTPKYTMRTLAYHEAVPGHHFQDDVLKQQRQLPFFRRILPVVAYSEGWALYAERLAWEMGYQQGVYDNIGRLRDELFRAARLVVDTGIHARRWSREEAIRYLSENTGMPERDVVAEVERYFVIPGQALAYKIGMTKIMELRELARSELGERFDIRGFHSVVLSNGEVPLTILEELVRAWIAERS